MLEASFVYPLMFLAMIAVICITISMYLGSVSKAGLNIRLMDESLRENDIGVMDLSHTDKFIKDKYSAPVFLKGERIFRTKFEGKAVFQGVKESEYSIYGLSTKKLSGIHRCRIYDLDEKKYIRKCDMVL